MTPLFIEFITDKQGHCKFKFNEKIVRINEIDEMEKLFNIFMKHLRFAYEFQNLKINDRLGIVADEINKEYPKWRDAIGYIKQEQDMRL